MKKTIEINISSDKIWWNDMKNILQKPPHDTHDEEVPTATALEMKRESINRVMISSLDGIVSKLLRNHFFREDTWKDPSYHRETITGHRNAGETPD